MIAPHTLYRSRGCAGYRLVMSSTDKGGGDELRYKYLVLVRYGVKARRSSHMDSSATEAELEAWGEVITDEADRAEIIACVTCKTETCTRITTRQSGTCTPCYAEANPKRQRFRNNPRGGKR